MTKAENSSYLGNTNLKREGIAIDFTPDMVQEYIKCANDPIYFAERYIKIVHVDHGFIPIQLYEYQKEIMEAFEKNRRVVVNSSRQSGKTTTAVAIILHYVIFNDYKTVALLANKGDSAREILDRIKLAYEALPKWLQHGVLEWNKGSVEFENGCKILAGSTSSSAIRGKSIAFLYIDETAFIENWDEFFASVFPTVSSGNTTKILFTSTPNGLNHFYSICMGAMDTDNPNGYNYIEVPWTRIPGRDEKWKQEQLRGMNFDIQKFNVEFGCQFEGSSGTLIDGSKLKELVPKTPIQEHRGLKMYERPEKDHIYVCTVDVSRGKGLDYSAFQVFDVTEMPYRQVCTFRDNMITPIDYAEFIFRVTKSYNNANILVEINDIGGQVAEILHFDLECENILFTENAGRSGKRISGGFGSNVDKGLRTTKTTKNIGCNILKLLIEQNQLIINDFETINELSTFSRKGNSYEAESGKHDDTVMCLVIFSWLTDQAFFRDMTDINTMTRLREKSEEELMNELLPFGFNMEEIIEETQPIRRVNEWGWGNSW